MRGMILMLVVGLGAGYGIALLAMPVADEPPMTMTARQPVGDINCVCDIQRLRDLERELTAERQENQALHDELQHLSVELENRGNPAANDTIVDSWFGATWAALAENEYPVDRRQLLLNGGFDEARADWLVARESELQMAAIEDEYSDPESSGAMDVLTARLAGRESLRHEIGDYEYEQYLGATGQSTAIAITQVLPESAALTAGLEPGDDIVEYDGQRVFNMIELADRARRGKQGEAVIVNIERNGLPMQIVVPRGPLGISGGKPSRH
jgi:hypothetical protein